MKVRWLRLALVAVLLATAFVALATSSPTAHAAPAATNGQQIELICPPEIYSMKVTGTNQSGNTVTWDYPELGGSGVVVTGGWWWIGNATITYSALNDQTGREFSNTTTIYVPKVWYWSTYTIDCDYK